MTGNDTLTPFLYRELWAFCVVEWPVGTLRRLVVLSLCVLTALAATTPLAWAAGDKAMKIGFVNPGFADKGFWKAVTDVMRAAARDLNADLVVRYGDRQWPLMVKMAEDLIMNGGDLDYLILVNEHQQAPALLRLADAKGIKTVLLLNTLTPKQEAEIGQPRAGLVNWLGAITPDNEIAGFEIADAVLTAAERAGLGLDGRIELLSLAGDHITPAALQRVEGLERALKKHPQAHEGRRLAVNWSQDEAYKRTRLWLMEADPEAVWAANDPIALGAIQAIREVGKTPGKDVFVAGLNWSPEALDLVAKGEMELTHGGHFLAGGWVMVMLYDHFHGADFAQIGAHIRFPMTAIGSGNVAAYQATFGDGDWSKIDFKSFSRAHHPGRTAYDFSIAAVLASARGQAR